MTINAARTELTDESTATFPQGERKFKSVYRKIDKALADNLLTATSSAQLRTLTTIGIPVG
jgi:hypothetical protein